ncbi:MULTISPECIES: tail protein X [Serratia]|uniref:tail protein X n=1 Tax=Serratia TaxID=613 RepID=UPI001932B4C0|nr:MULTISPECIES: tail protein X [Serratia]UJD79826.1 phage tail protein [Serratia rubidaea]UJD84382.1 phage tail protein [Serratia rubidaea]WBF43761.1 tail protein X [Serratia rubidaea]CAE1144991.1 Phage tail protein [Serratia sp. Tan611]
MKVKAMQGDTLDLLCQRHYGTTQGVTEAVLSANPGIAEQIFLTVGQVIELPDIAQSTEREAVQLWT